MLNFREKFIQFLARSMKSKLNRRRGFTIAEIIMAVAIMGILIATVMRSLQSSRKSIDADMCRGEMYKRIALIKGKVEAAVLAGYTPNANLSNILTAEELLDAKNQRYAITFTLGTPAQDYTLEITPGADIQALGVGKETVTWPK